MKNLHTPLILFLIVIIASLIRLFFSYITFDTEWSNFSPLAAILLIVSTFLKNKKNRIFIVFSIYLLSDFLVNYFIYGQSTLWYSSMWGNILAVLFIIFIASTLLQTISIQRVLLASISISLGHYFFSDLAVWLSSGMYALTWPGFVSCYTLALPFLKNTLISNVVYVTLFFAVYEWIYRSKENISFTTKRKINYWV